MKPIQYQVTKYVCETCKSKYSSPQEAKKCEDAHFKFKVGDKVVYHTGSYGGEQGQRSPSWWPENKDGVVIEVIVNKCMVEFKDRSRLWCSNHSMSAG